MSQYSTFDGIYQNLPHSYIHLWQPQRNLTLNCHIPKHVSLSFVSCVHLRAVHKTYAHVRIVRYHTHVPPYIKKKIKNNLKFSIFRHKAIIQIEAD